MKKFFYAATLFGMVHVSLAQQAESMLFDFNTDADAPSWSAVNDGVMGGLSAGQPEMKDGALHFKGTLSLENNGGFSSIRTSAVKLDLSASKQIRLRILGDGRTYQLRLATDARYRDSKVAYYAEFASSAGKWVEVVVPFSSMIPSHHGDDLEGPPLDLSKIQEVGILIADKKAGKFSLIVDWLKAE